MMPPGSINRDVQGLLKALESSQIGGRSPTTIDRLVQLRGLAEMGGLQTLEPLLPLCLTLNGKPYHLGDHFPFSPLFKVSMPKTLVLKTGRQLSKCVANTAECRVYLDNGRPVSGSELRIGDRVLCVDSSRKAATGVVVDKISAGERPILRITTRTGGVLDVATTHPLQKVTGWVEASQLQVGDRVAAMRSGGRFGTLRVDTARIVLTAYLLGDGCTVGNFHVSGIGPEVREECVLYGQLFQDFPIRRSDTAVYFSTASDSQLIQWLRADGLMGKYAWEKKLPAWVYELPRQDAALFLSRLWATDGMISNYKNGSLAITYTSTSRRLAYDVRALLTKFGIPTSVSQIEAGYKQKCGTYKRCRDAYVVRVETRAGWRRFFEEFSVPDKPAIPIPETTENNNRNTVPLDISGWIAELAGQCCGTDKPALHQVGLRKKPKYALTYEKLRQYVEFFRQHNPTHPRLRDLEDLLGGDVIWDEVESIELLGKQECWDIEVESEHNYVLDGVVVHNSTSVAANGVLLSNSIPFFKSLYICPLYESVRRFSNNYVKPFINNSPIKSLWSGTSTENSVLQRTFKNNSLMLFSFAFTDCDRIRGISADLISIDEAQDFNPDHYPIVREVMSHSKFSITRLTGTPKSKDNFIEGSWLRSSQAEWFIPCFSCGRWNIPSLEFHLDKMIGPYHDDISEKCPATICYKCQRPIFPRQGHWVHRYPQRRWLMAGYHVPQIIIPLHYATPDKWSELLAKREGWGNTTQAKFYNEVLGESVDAGQKLISETELRRSAILPWKNNPQQPDPEVMRRLDSYQMRVLAVDWGGGGEEGVSFTTLALLGFNATGNIDVLWGKRLVISQEHLREAKEVLGWARAFRCHLFVHDYTGAGVVRETVMVQAGFDLNRVMPIQYTRAASSNLMRFVPATPLHNRSYYRLDKTRSLLYAFQAIKLRLIRTFQYDWINADNPGLLHDFLALVEEKVESRLAGDIYTITRNPILSDDFAQAVNIGCAAIWHANDAWPNYADAAAIGKLSSSQILATGSGDYGWDEDRSSFFEMP